LITSHFQSDEITAHPYERQFALTSVLEPTSSKTNRSRRFRESPHSIQAPSQLLLTEQCRRNQPWLSLQHSSKTYAKNHPTPVPAVRVSLAKILVTDHLSVLVMPRMALDTASRPCGGRGCHSRNWSHSQSRRVSLVADQRPVP